MQYTNQEFRADLERYLRFKKAKHAKRAEMPAFFKRLFVDPCYEAKTDFVQRLIDKIDSLAAQGDINTTNRETTRGFRNLVRSGLNGREGFRYGTPQLGLSTLYQLLMKKSMIFAEDRKSYSTISPHHG